MKSHDVHAIKRTQYDMHWKSFVDKRKLKDIYPGYTQLVCLFSLQEKSLSTKKKRVFILCHHKSCIYNLNLTSKCYRKRTRFFEAI